MYSVPSAGSRNRAGSRRWWIRPGAGSTPWAGWRHGARAGIVSTGRVQSVRRMSSPVPVTRAEVMNSRCSVVKGWPRRPAAVKCSSTRPPSSADPSGRQTAQPDHSQTPGLNPSGRAGPRSRHPPSLRGRIRWIRARWWRWFGSSATGAARVIHSSAPPRTAGSPVIRCTGQASQASSSGPSRRTSCGRTRGIVGAVAGSMRAT